MHTILELSQYLFEFNIQIYYLSSLFLPPSRRNEVEWDMDYLTGLERRGRNSYKLLRAQIFIAIQFLILGYHMNLGKPGADVREVPAEESSPPKQSSQEQSEPRDQSSNPHLAFEKNYPKNIFIPMIEHLSERGLQREYEQCVGTREGFEGKNVVSLAEIHKVMSQEWFSKGINLAALVSSMSNKILMNSKIKKKLFHLLLIKELFTIPVDDAREFKKMVSKKANEVSQSKLSDDPLFHFPSALIYLLHIFAEGLSKADSSSSVTVAQQQIRQQQGQRRLRGNEQQRQGRGKRGQTSSKLEYKYYISKIILWLNSYQGDSADFLDLIDSIKSNIQQREKDIRIKYGLTEYVPEWSYFNSIVVHKCCLTKRNRHRLTYSLLNSWIQEFKERSCCLKGFMDIMQLGDGIESQREYKFSPIVLISPPQ